MKKTPVLVFIYIYKRMVQFQFQFQIHMQKWNLESDLGSSSGKSDPVPKLRPKQFLIRILLTGTSGTQSQQF
jgi:hypothetical protein